MTSFYKGQKERGERVTDNVGMSSWSELLWLLGPCLLLPVSLKISIIFSLVPCCASPRSNRKAPALTNSNNFIYTIIPQCDWITVLLVLK
jgi:hypothetical protein